MQKLGLLESGRTMYVKPKIIAIYKGSRGRGEEEKKGGGGGGGGDKNNNKEKTKNVIISFTLEGYDYER